MSRTSRASRTTTRMALLAANALIVIALAIGVVAPTPTHARPTYFDTFTTLYGIGGSDNLNACGVCHVKWTGTGARNLFGSAVEQQLYLGKSITQSIIDVEGDDADGDSFTNGAEIMSFMTLPRLRWQGFRQRREAW